MADTLRVVVTGAAGQIAYALLYNIAKGDVFGSTQRMDLVLLDIPPMMTVVDGVVLELQDCALPLVNDVVSTSEPDVAFKGADVAFMVGAMPRREGMERKDLLKANRGIFEIQGKSVDQHAKKTIKVLVVGNPANTNALIMQRNAPSIPAANFSALTRLDQNRAQAQIALRLGVACDAVNKCIIWGNHSSTQYPDISHATVSLPNQGAPASVVDAVKDDAWLKGDFIKVVQTRGGAIIKARKLSSAMSAAKAICDHMRDWWHGTQDGQWVSMGVISDGNSYGIPKGIIYSFPVKCSPDHSWKIVDGLNIDVFSREKMDATAKELIEEREQALEC